MLYLWHFACVCVMLHRGKATSTESFCIELERNKNEIDISSGSELNSSYVFGYRRVLISYWITKRCCCA